MATTRELRQRIKSVKNIQHITKAMKMVAAARLRRAQERAVASKQFALKIREILSNVVNSEIPIKNSLLEAKENKKNVAYYIVGADKGLAGAYTSNVIKEALKELSTCENPHLISVGRKVKEYFTRRQYKLDDQFEGFSEKPEYSDARAIVSGMTEKYLSGEYDEINIVYTEFYSPLSQKPVVMKVLPVESPVEIAGDNQTDYNKTEYIFEPSAKDTLEVLIPQYLETFVYTALVQASASELGSRMAAMSAATENSSEIIDQLTLSYNKIRQAGITREISEIVAGAEALQ